MIEEPRDSEGCQEGYCQKRWGNVTVPSVRKFYKSIMPKQPAGGHLSEGRGQVLDEQSFALE